MIQELLQKQENKSLKIFSKKTSDFGSNHKFDPEICAEKISDKLIIIVKKNLSQQIGFKRTRPSKTESQP